MVWKINKFIELIKNGNVEEARAYLQRENPDNRELDLCNNRLNTPEALTTLGNAIKGTNIITLNLSGNKINNAKALTALGNAIKDTNIITLNLSRNKIDNTEALTALGNLQSTNVTTLHLTRNYFDTPEEITALGSALQSTNVIMLNLSYNRIKTPDALTALGALQGTNVTSLDLSYNRIKTPDALTALGALQGTNVTWFNLAGNDIRDKHVPDILKLLEANPKITDIIVDSKNHKETISSENRQNLAKALARNAGKTQSLQNQLIGQFAAGEFVIENPNKLSSDLLEKIDSRREKWNIPTPAAEQSWREKVKQFSQTHQRQ